MVTFIISVFPSVFVFMLFYGLCEHKTLNRTKEEKTVTASVKCKRVPNTLWSHINTQHCHASSALA